MENRGSVTAIGNDFNEQECIPVGCVPSAAVAVSWWGMSAQGVVCPGGCVQAGVPRGMPVQGWVSVCLLRVCVCVCVCVCPGAADGNKASKSTKCYFL